MSVRNIITISIIKCLNVLSELLSNWVVKWMTIYDEKKKFENNKKKYLNLFHI